MIRTDRRLADGRPISWYDPEGAAPRDPVDLRDLPVATTSSRARYDVLADEWVTVASHRQGRTFMPPAEDCPLCPSRDGRSTEIPSEDYQVVVFENRFPSFAAPRGDAEVGEVVESGDPLFLERAGVGRCEVVCFTSDHGADFAALEPEQVRLVVDAWADRTRELGRLEEVELVYPFENRGAEIGVTLAHPHGQIYAYPFVPPRARRKLASARAYLERTRRNLFADLLDAERRDGSRVVAEGRHWTAFVPYAARWPVEVHLYPHRQVPDLPALDAEEREDFSRVYLDVLRRLDALYGTRLPYIAAWQQAPVRVDRDLAHLHLEVFSTRRSADKLKYLAGSESGMGAFLNDVSPEETAQRLRSLDIDSPLEVVHS